MAVDMELRDGVVMPGLGDVPEMTPLGYSEIISRLDLLADRQLQTIIAIQAGYAEDHGQVSTFEPMQRPVTAIQKVREIRERSLLLETEREIFGGLTLEILQIGDE